MCVFAFIFEIEKKLNSILGHYFVDWFNLVFCAKQKKKKKQQQQMKLVKGYLLST